MSSSIRKPYRPEKILSPLQLAKYEEYLRKIPARLALYKYALSRETHFYLDIGGHPAPGATKYRVEIKDSKLKITGFTMDKYLRQSGRYISWSEFEAVVRKHKIEFLTSRSQCERQVAILLHETWMTSFV